MHGLGADVDDSFVVQPPREQAPLASEPYDRWVLPGECVKAEFHRQADGFLLRFLGEADFVIDADCRRVTGWPVQGIAENHFHSLYCNAVLPLIGDHLGGLFLHGSAVSVGGRALVFLGQSGDGKTTLAGAFAKAGHPYLTEDVIELVVGAGTYHLQPKASGLRLFADSAAYLIGDDPEMAQGDEKIDVTDAVALPFQGTPAPLAAIFVLGSDHDALLAIARLHQHRAAQLLLPHSFVLDVDDKGRLRGHFGRIVGLACDVPCYSIDYLRDYAELPRLIEAVAAEVNKVGARNDE